MNRRVTVRDVAAAAGVSQATASRALSGNQSVSPVLVRRVVAASTRLGYKANVMARALRTRRTGTIGVVVPSIGNPYFTGAVEALEGVLAETQRSLILCDARESATTEAERMQLLVDRMVDGLVIIPTSTTESVAALGWASEHTPVVQFDRYVVGTGTDFVGSDNAEGLRQMVSHVRERGCTTMAYVGSASPTSTAAERHHAFQALTAAAPAPGHWELLGDFTTEWGRQAGRQILEGGRLPDAIVCGADIIAAGLLSVLRDARVRVPEDVMVVSHDDSTIGLITSPRLTSVRQPLDDMAREAVRLLDARSQGQDHRPPRLSVLTPRLIVRESTLLKTERVGTVDEGDG